MEELFEELLVSIKQKWYLRERIHLAETLEGAKELFIMVCCADSFHVVGRHGYNGRLTDEVIERFYEFMKGQRL